MKRRYFIAIFVLILVLAAFGWYQFKSIIDDNSNHGSVHTSKADGIQYKDQALGQPGKVVKYWYDPMVPNQKFDKPGKSPFMDMQLVPKYEDAEHDNNHIVISPQTQQNLGIRLETVSKAMFGNAISAVGRIEPDERRLFVVQTRIPGFVERLYRRAVGDPVTKGQKLAELYAPDLLAAQQEYLAVLGLGHIDDAGSLIQGSRNRLKLLGMTEREIAGITKTGQAITRIGIYSPASGVVSELGVREGGQLMSGASLMQVTDLSRVWLIAEVPERAVNQVTLGSEASVQLQGMPGEDITGKVSYLYPTLDESSRTLRVRIELDNRSGNFRPGMYANVSLGQNRQPMLAVPTESIIATGQRSIVITKTEQGFRPAEVITGMESNGKTQILRGLAEGERVVVSGQFLIDSEASLSGVLARLSAQDPSGSAIDSPVEASMNATETMPSMQMKTPAMKYINGQGNVMGVDTSTSEVTLSHEPIPAIGWPAMTMGFKVKDSKQLQPLKAGDRVQFSLVKEPDSDAYAIEHIEKAATVTGVKP